MKKLCLFLVCLTFISSMPSFAMKVIVNNENDRIVYSRSSGFDDDGNYGTFNINLNSYEKRRNPAQNNYELGLLGTEFRTELAGTKWHLVNNTPQKPIEKNLNDRNSREAADYYYIDKYKAPDTLIPSWF